MRVCTCAEEDASFAPEECNCPDVITWFREAVEAYENRGSYAQAVRELEESRDHIRKLMLEAQRRARVIIDLTAQRDDLQRKLNDVAVGG